MGTRYFRNNSKCLYEADILWKFNKKYPKIIKIKNMFLNKQIIKDVENKNIYIKILEKKILNSIFNQIKTSIDIDLKISRISWLFISLKIPISKDIRLKIALQYLS